MTINPYDSPHELGDAPEKQPVRWMPIFLKVLAGFGVLAMLIALLLPAVRTPREAVRRVQCSNNLKQIALGLQNYVDINGALPPAYTVDAEGKPLHSWRTLILPYMEQKALFDKIDLLKPWDDPANKTAFDTHVPTYHCPSAAGDWRHTSYFAPVGPDRCLHSTEPRKLAEITDDHGLTLMLVEGNPAAAVHWMSPMYSIEQKIPNPGTESQRNHPVGFNGVMVDGGSRFFDENTAPARLRALLTIAGGDDNIAGVGNR